jgi:hypothetical protein
MFRLWNAGTCSDDYVEVTMSYCKLSRWEGGKGILVASTMTDATQYTLSERHLAQRDYDATVALMRGATGLQGKAGEPAFALRKEIFG